MMEKGGLILLVLLFVVGFSVGYLYPLYTSNQTPPGQEPIYFSQTVPLESERREFDLLSSSPFINTDAQEYKHLTLGWNAYEAELYVAALEEFSGARDLNANNYAPFLGLGWSHLRLGNYEKAVENFEQAIALFSGADSYVVGFAATHHFTGLGFAQLKAQNYDAAITAFDNALLVQPDNVLSFLGFAILYYELEDIDRANRFSIDLQNYPREHPDLYQGFSKQRDYIAFTNCMAPLAYVSQNVYNCAMKLFP